MIFLLFTILWILFADSIWCFLIPIVSLIIRASYRERNIKLFKIYPIIFALLLFLANHFLSEKPLNENLLLSFRIVVFSGLLLHIFDSATRGSLKSLSRLDYLIYTGIRVMSIVEERLSDTWHIFKTRWVHTKLLKKPSLVAFTFANFLLESLVIYNQIQLVNYEKGGLALSKNKNYSVDDKKSFHLNLSRSKRIMISYSTIGDIFLLVIILLPPSLIGLNIIPKKFTTIIDYISSLL
jgi:hypothetical protein